MKIVKILSFIFIALVLVGGGLFFLSSSKSPETTPSSMKFKVVKAEAVNGLTEEELNQQDTPTNTDANAVASNDNKEPVEPMFLGYYTKYSETDTSAQESLEKHHSYLDTVSIFTYDLNAKGDIVLGQNPQQGIDTAKKHNKQTYAVITNKFDGQLSHTILNDPKLRTRTVLNILKLLEEQKYTGVNLDFEDLMVEDRDTYSNFVEQLANTIKPKGYKLIVSAVSKTEDDPTLDWTGPFDYKALGTHADYIQLMTYDQNGPWGQPGPVAGADWVESVLKYATTQIPSEKILIGLNAYGYNWNTTTGKNHTALAWGYTKEFVAKVNAQVQWDDKSKSPFFHYVDSAGNNRTVYFENEQSLTAKMDLVHKYRLAGVSVWRMGLEDEEFWKVIHKSYNAQ